MQFVKKAKLYFFFAVLLFVAKPFLGFSIFNRAHPPTAGSIFVKVFTKRKQEFIEDGDFDISAIQDKLAAPIRQLFLRFSYFLNILFPVVFGFSASPTSSFLEGITLKLAVCRQTYLVNGQLII